MPGRPSESPLACGVAGQAPDAPRSESMLSQISTEMVRLQKQHYGRADRRHGGGPDGPEGRQLPEPGRLRPDVVFEIFIFEDELGQAQVRQTAEAQLGDEPVREVRGDDVDVPDEDRDSAG